MGAGDGEFEVKIDFAAPYIQGSGSEIHFHKEHLLFCLNAAIRDYWNRFQRRELE